MINIPKKWRELPKEERFNIPIKKFNISREEIESIRKIKDSKTKLIEAAKLQYEMFNDIHSYLTAWIAGYGSDVIIRQKFGSTQNLLDLFFKKINIPKNISPSWSDIKRRIKIPKKMNGELAEEVGIHIGDGNLYVYTNKKGHRSFFYTISGDLTNEYDYHEKHIKKLMKRLYSIDTTLIKRTSKNNVDTRIKSKSIVEFKNKILGLPIGNKKNIKIPEQIIKNNEFSKRCVVGIIDTDFSITSSLAITGKLNNLNVVKQISEIFNKNKIPFKLTIYENYGRFYIRKEGAIKIIKEWKLKNLKHTSKYQCYQKFKNIFSHSTTSERLSLLNGKLSAKELKEICEKRKYAPGRI